MEFDIEFFTPNYPKVTTKNFQSIISSKKEFNELVPDVNDELTSTKKFFNNQIFFQRFMSVYDDIFYIGDTGIGKTRSLIALAQYYKHNRPDEIRKFYFITGKTQIDDFKRQLLEAFPEEYYTEDIKSRVENRKQGYKEDIGIGQRKKRSKNISNKETDARTNAVAAAKRERTLLKKSIGTWYELMTYGQFAKKINEFDTDEALSNYFSNTGIFIDEVQKLKLDPSIEKSSLTAIEKGKTKKKNPDEYITIRQRFREYIQIWRLLHVAKNCKKMISTATPISNHIDELLYEMNLLLPVDQQILTDISRYVADECNIEISGKEYGEEFVLPTTVEILRRMSDNIDIDEILNDKEQLKEIKESEEFIKIQEEIEKDFELLMRGKIMYIRAKATGAIAVYPEKDESDEILMPLAYVTMSEFQTKAYAKTVDKDPRKIKATDNLDMKDKDRFHLDKLQASNFVFPKWKTPSQWDANNGTWGEVGYNENSSIDEEGKLNPNENFMKYLANPENLKNSSIKYWYIVNGAYNPNKGKRYVSTNFYNGSGAKVLGWALEASNLAKVPGSGGRYSEYLPSESAFVTYKGKQRLSNTIRKANRYAIVSDATSIKDSHKHMFELFNSPENVRGEYLKVIIVTKIGQVGINLNDVEHIDKLEAYWTPAADYQSRNRAFRATSHVNSLKWVAEQRKEGNINANYFKELGKGFLENDTIPYHHTVPKTKGFKVYVNNYVGIPDDEIKNSEGLPYDSIDVQLYAHIEEKDVQFREVLRFMKRISVDAKINAGRNIRKSDIDFTSECDYTFCSYEPYNDIDLPYDTSTYDAYYSNNTKNDIMQILAEQFIVHSAMTAKQIAEFTVYNERQVIYALFDIITSKEKIYVDKFGYNKFLCEYNGVYFTKRETEFSLENHDYASSYYDDNLIATMKVSLTDVANEYTNELGIKKIKDIYKDIDILDITTMTMDEKALLFEDAVLKYTVDENEIAFSIINMEEFKNLGFEVIDQTNRIFEYEYELKDLRAKKDKLIETQYIEDTNEENGYIWIHNIYGVDANTTNYNPLEISGKIRILDGKFWRDANGIEKIVYSKMFKSHDAKEIAKLTKKNRVIGMILSQGHFHILDYDKKQDVTIGVNKVDGRKKYGKECHSYKKWELIDFLYRTGYGTKYQYSKKLDRVKTYRSLMKDAQLKLRGSILDMDTVDGKSDKLVTKPYEYKDTDKKWIVWTNERLEFFEIMSKKNEYCNIIKKHFIKKGIIYDRIGGLALLEKNFKKEE